MRSVLLLLAFILGTAVVISLVALFCLFLMELIPPGFLGFAFLCLCSVFCGALLWDVYRAR